MLDLLGPDNDPRPVDEAAYWIADRKEWCRALKDDVGVDPKGFDAWCLVSGRPTAEQITSRKRIEVLAWLKRGGARLVNRWLDENPSRRGGRHA